ncbi:MAG: rod shape-determining protein RodA [Tidjanibacter sp.]|nr:rod shape-determining protein RodA [Tidjanibacter sp.]
MPNNANYKSGTSRYDWKSIAIFVALVVIGWFNIYAAVYNETAVATFSLTQKYGMQLIWIGISLVVAVVVLLVDDIYYHVMAYPFYGIMLFLLVLTLFVGRTVNGARSWISLGPASFQPAEFMKLAVALALARLMSEYNFSLHKPRDLVMVCLLLFAPIVVVILQNDTGSALVYASFLVMLYREGLNRWVYYALFLVVGLFVFSFLLSPTALLVLLLTVCIVGQTISNRNIRQSLIFAASTLLLSIVVWGGSHLVGHGLSFYWSLLSAAVVSTVPAAIYAFRRKLSNIYLYIAMFLGSLVFIGTVDYVFDNVLQVHQQKRILDLLGLESDLRGWGYNVNQSKIAIGSGGLFGKGYLEGTQTKYDFIPEQSTDFIFCTVGEEWGFVGALVVLGLFCLLIIRLMKMGERQQEPFRRVYCYSVAGVFLFHTIVNVAMTVGLMPVIGIPLPMFSYGGSSLLSFTLLFFIAVRLDSQNSSIGTVYKPF